MKRIETIDDLTPDHANANRGTDRGSAMLRKSMGRNGAGRSILVDADGRVIAGNKTLQAATDAGLPIRIVETDGSELVVVRRTDLDLSDPSGKARELAFADNRTGEVNLEWDAMVILEASRELPDIREYFDQGEIDELVRLAGNDVIDAAQGDASDAFGSLPDGDKAPFQQITFTLHDSQAEAVKRALERAKDCGPFEGSPNENSNGNALARIVEAFLHG